MRLDDTVVRNKTSHVENHVLTDQCGRVDNGILHDLCPVTDLRVPAHASGGVNEGRHSVVAGDDGGEQIGACGRVADCNRDGVGVQSAKIMHDGQTSGSMISGGTVVVEADNLVPARYDQVGNLSRVPTCTDQRYSHGPPPLPRNSVIVACSPLVIPSRLTVFHSVRQRILRSSHSDMLSTYQTSSSNLSSHES